MDSAQDTLAKLIFIFYLDQCNINAVSIEVVVKMSWPNLELLSLCQYWLILEDNNIGSKGAKLLSRANLRNLKYIGLGK